jgi:hypothetical protein
MTVEIGSLVVRGTFGGGSSGDVSDEKLKAELARLRRELLEQMRDMIAEAERRRGS